MPTFIRFQYQFHLPKHYLVQGKLKCWKYPTDPKIENWTSRDNQVNLHSLLIVANSDGLWSSLWNINADFESPSVKQSLQLIFSVNNQARINCKWAGFSSCIRIGRQYEELPGREDRASWLSYWRFYNRLEGQIHRRLFHRCLVCGKKWSMVWRGHLWLLCGLSEIWLFWVLSGALISTERPTRAHFSCWRSKLVQGAGTRKGSIDKRQKTRFNAEDKINKPNPPRWIRFTQPLHWNFNWGWGGGKKKGLMQELGVKGGRKEERSRRWLGRAG